jgi:lambda family phage holin
MLEKIPPDAQAFIMAFLISVLRIIYDRKETQALRILLEALICGFLAIGVGRAILALGLSTDWTLFSASFIGFFGTVTVRSLALKLVNAKIK